MIYDESIGILESICIGTITREIDQNDYKLDILIDDFRMMYLQSRKFDMHPISILMLKNNFLNCINLSSLSIPLRALFSLDVAKRLPSDLKELRLTIQSGLTIPIDYENE